MPLSWLVIALVVVGTCAGLAVLTIVWRRSRVRKRRLAEEELQLRLRYWRGEPHRSAYRRWLEHHGDPRGAVLRLEAELLEDPDGPRSAERREELRQQLTRVPAEWWGSVRRDAQIRHCGSGLHEAPKVRFVLPCKQVWSSLEPKGTEGVRSCAVCATDVYFCRDANAVREHALAGRCVAVPPELVTAEQQAATTPMLGRPDADAEWAKSIFGQD